MIHLVIVALRAVAVETESLVGHQLLGAGVNGSTDGNATDRWLARGIGKGSKSGSRESLEEKIRSDAVRDGTAGSN